MKYQDQDLGLAITVTDVVKSKKMRIKTDEIVNSMATNLVEGIEEVTGEKNTDLNDGVFTICIMVVPLKAIARVVSLYVEVDADDKERLNRKLGAIKKEIKQMWITETGEEF